MRKAILAIATCAIVVGGTGVSAQAATSGSPGHATPNVTPAKAPKGCKIYKMYEAAREYKGTLTLCNKSKLWEMGGQFEGESGYYETAKKEIQLVETSRSGYEECEFFGLKGKKKILYSGTWNCYFPEEGSDFEGTWEAEK